LKSVTQTLNAEAQTMQLILIELDANLVNADIQTRLQTADIVNSVVIRYDDPVLEVVAQNDTSINAYGLLEEVRLQSLLKQQMPQNKLQTLSTTEEHLKHHLEAVIS
jgi:hypothetical protein